MCANYLPATKSQLEHHFEVEVPDVDFEAEVFPGYFAPFIAHSKARATFGQKKCSAGRFGLVAPWAEIATVRETHNARTEGVEAKPSYRNAFQQRQFCIIPVSSMFEWKHLQAGKQRWKITSADGGPLGIAGIWEFKRDGFNGDALLSFAMLTINATDHPLYSQYNAPSDEKRMPVILRPDHFEKWMNCRPQEAWDFFEAYPADGLVEREALTSRADDNQLPLF